MRKEDFEVFKMPTEVVLRINFNCAGCGKCCKNRGNLMVMTMDVFRVCKYLGISVKEFMDKYMLKVNDGKRMWYQKLVLGLKELHLLEDETL